MKRKSELSIAKHKKFSTVMPLLKTSLHLGLVAVATCTLSFADTAFLTVMTGIASAQQELSSETPSPFGEGQLTLKISSGSRTETHLYQRKGNQLRIDRPGDLIPTPPLNIVNLRSGRITILFPQNGTARTIETANEKPTAPSIPFAPGDRTMLALPPGIGPEPSQLPVSPDGTPPELPIGVPANPAMPMVTEMPHLPPMHGKPGAVETFVLKASEETQTLHGYPCTRHTLELPHEGRLILWLTPDEPLFPFHRLRTEGHESFRPPEWPDQLAALLRSKGLFPLLISQHEREHSAGPAENASKPGRELARWEVTSIQHTSFEDPEETLFTTPASFHQLRD